MIIQILFPYRWSLYSLAKFATVKLRFQVFAIAIVAWDPVLVE